MAKNTVITGDELARAVAFNVCNPEEMWVNVYEDREHKDRKGYGVPRKTREDAVLSNARREAHYRLRIKCKEFYPRLTP